MANGHNTFETIDKMLTSEDYTSLTLTQRDILLLAAIKDVYDALKPLPAEVKTITERVERLERRNVVMFAERHPKAAIFIAGIVLLLGSLWQTISPVILAMLGLPTMPVP